MNLAVHGLEGQISQSNTYYEDPHHAVGAFDYVMANPPFNVNRIDKAKLEGDPRFPFGLPRADNGNYIWIQRSTPRSMRRVEQASSWRTLRRTPAGRSWRFAAS